MMMRAGSNEENMLPVRKKLLFRISKLTGQGEKQNSTKAREQNYYYYDAVTRVGGQCMVCKQHETLEQHPNRRVWTW